jgi:TetR/AcrR family transcriptional repressor of nem operon
LYSIDSINSDPLNKENLPSMIIAETKLVPETLKKNTATKDTKAHLLNTGYQLIAKKGFTGVGIKEILDSAGVPKGSFYHYFTSKEAFGEATIAQYFEKYKHRLDTIAAQEVSPQQKIYDYFEQWYDTQQYGCDEGRCLVVKLSAEVADISEPMRCALADGYQQVIAWLSTQIKAGWDDGSVPRPANIAAESLAKRWYYAWLGASLMAKTNQSNTPLAEVWQMTTTELGR